MNQKEVFKWRCEAFETQPFPLLQALKVCEESGELAGAVGKRHTNVRGTQEHWTQEIRKEAADVLFALFTVAEVEGFDLLDNAREQWERVSQKNYINGISNV